MSLYSLVTHIHVHSYFSGHGHPVPCIPLEAKTRLCGGPEDTEERQLAAGQKLFAHLCCSVTSQCLRWSLLVPVTVMASMLCARRSVHPLPVLECQHQDHHLPQQVGAALPRAATLQWISCVTLHLKGHIVNPRDGWFRARIVELCIVLEMWEYFRVIILP